MLPGTRGWLTDAACSCSAGRGYVFAQDRHFSFGKYFPQATPLEGRELGNFLVVNFKQLKAAPLRWVNYLSAFESARQLSPGRGPRKSQL